VERDRGAQRRPGREGQIVRTIGNVVAFTPSAVILRNASGPLALARWIAEMHGGHLTLARSSEAGSTFTAFLPHPS